ncbi:MAG: CDP-alcohol phosphatidyltransferase family protein [Methanomicrobiales archaeon]|nr:CDP-alcohol phosphatidyltransferase family protein [Methanomicrobiales archaeon]
MTLDRLRPYTAVLLRPFTELCLRAGITPNFFSAIAFLAAAAAGGAFYARYLALAILFVIVNAFSDALDGTLARAMKKESLRGDFLDHVLDRYADLFIIIGIFAGGAASWPIGVFALTGVLMASYIGTQAQAVGVGRYYGGILGRADRLVLIIIAGILDLLSLGRPFSLPYLGWLLLIFGLFGHWTAIQRFLHVWGRMG